MNSPDLKKILETDIISEKGIGDISIGMSAENFIERYVKPEYFYHTQELVLREFFPDILDYLLLNSISVYVSARDAKVVGITLSNHFQGKYKGVGIGDTIQDLKQIGEKISFDDDFAMLGDSWCLNFVADDDLTSTTCDVDNCKIEEIQIRPSRLSTTRQE